MLPTLAIVGRDMGGTTFSSPGLLNSTNERPTALAQSVDVGFSLNPIINKSLRHTFAFEVRGATTLSEEEDQTKRYHVGYEMNINDFLFVRTGMHQKSPTFGLEFASQYTQIQFASWFEEVGTAASPRADQRYIVKFVFRL